MTRREQVATFVESNRLQRAIIAVIVFNAITLGLETSDSVMTNAGGVLNLLDRVVLGIFIVELSLRSYAHGWKFLRDP